jgi:hypothetical protein
MKTSLIIVSTLLTLSVFIPFFYFIYNGLKNTNNTSKKAAILLTNNGITYSVKDIWHNYYIGLSDDKKTLTYMNVSTQNPININILLSEIKQCNIIRNNTKGKDNVISLHSLHLEFQYKSTNKPNLIVSFYNTDDDLLEDFEMQRIEKWQEIIKKALPEKTINKLAS